MTLPDQMENENPVDEGQLKAAAQILMTSIKQAYRRHGLTCGLTSCAQVLKSNPSNIMLCVLSETLGNVSLHIHQTLIEAFCRENNIPVLKIKDPTKLSAHMLKLEQTKKRGGRNQGMSGKCDDVSCILLETSKRGPSKQDEALLKFCNTAIERAMHHLSIPD